jgi:hypothetical protein
VSVLFFNFRSIRALKCSIEIKQPIKAGRCEARTIKHLPSKSS